MNRKRIISLFLVSLFIFLGGSAFCLESSEDKSPDPADIFDLSVGIDVPIIAAGSLLFISGIIIEPVSGEQQSEDNIFLLDRTSIFSYNSSLDRSCDFLFAASLLFPVSTVIGADLDTFVETGVMFMESLLLTYAAKDILKNLIPRYRPYTYREEPVDDDYMNSFPSGHTSAVFAVCGFSAYVFSERYPDSEWKLPVIIGAYTIAAATATLRVVSGNHFITDVTAGALIGSLFGIGVPFLHKNRIAEGSGIELGLAVDDNPALTVSYRR